MSQPHAFRFTPLPPGAVTLSVPLLYRVLIPNHIQAAHDAWLAAGAPKAQPNLVQLVQSVPSVRALTSDS